MKGQGGEKDMFDTSRIHPMLDKVQTYLGQWLEDHLKQIRPADWWERCVMDQYTFLYRIYSGAVENGCEEYADKAEEYKQILLSVCDNVTYSENEPYVDYFLKYVSEEE
jgi:hypothetical protein